MNISSCYECVLNIGFDLTLGNSGLEVLVNNRTNNVRHDQEKYIYDTKEVQIYNIYSAAYIIKTCILFGHKKSKNRKVCITYTGKTFPELWSFSVGKML